MRPLALPPRLDAPREAPSSAPLFLRPPNLFARFRPDPLSLPLESSPEPASLPSISDASSATCLAGFSVGISKPLSLIKDCGAWCKNASSVKTVGLGKSFLGSFSNPARGTKNVSSVSAIFMQTSSFGVFNSTTVASPTGVVIVAPTLGALDLKSL